MKVLFVIPWVKTLFGDEFVAPGHPHLGIAYLAALIKREGHQVLIFDQGIENDDSKLYAMIESEKPDLIGVTAFSYCLKYVMEVIKELKEKTSVPVMIGGPHVAAVKQEIMDKTPVDFAMKGEAEVSFLTLLDEMKKGKDANYDIVGGLIYRTATGEIRENKDDPYIKDVDNLPFPDFDAFKFEKYTYFRSKTIPIITSRGCPYGCNFCSVKLSMGRNFRPRSPENVLAEIELWYKRGFTNFEFNDDCFSVDIPRAVEICKQIVQRKLKIKWQLYNGIRADRINEELMKWMKKSGCIMISFGCESGDQDVVNFMGKALDLKKVPESVRLANKYGIKNSVNFIIGHPTETFEKAMNTVKFAESLGTGFVNFYNIIPYPGSSLYSWVDKNGTWLYDTDDILQNIGSRDLKPVFETPEFTREERIKALKIGFALYEKTIMQFRFGKAAGTMFYYFTRIPLIFRFSRYFALNNPMGNVVYNFLTKKSRE